MVEAFLVETDESCIAALVLGVAALALTLRETAVESGGSSHIGADVLMAVHAQTRLSAAIEAHVAFAAIGFQLRMSVDELARHQGGLKALGCSHARAHGEYRKN